VDFASRRVTLDGEDVKLTATEYKLLAYLALNAGRIITPDQLLNKVWGHEYVGTPHLLQVNMARLRKKLGDDAKNPKYIIKSPVSVMSAAVDGTVNRFQQQFPLCSCCNA
jgi:two-component system KDP operon response regulator KdpE